MPSGGVIIKEVCDCVWDETCNGAELSRDLWAWTAARQSSADLCFMKAKPEGVRVQGVQVAASLECNKQAGRVGRAPVALSLMTKTFFSSPCHKTNCISVKRWQENQNKRGYEKINSVMSPVMNHLSYTCLLDESWESIGFQNI